jgi:sugar lactone lactonase YvrE
LAVEFDAIAEGFHLEGICPDGDDLWFSDVFVTGLQRRRADGSVEMFLDDTPMIPSMLVNVDGKVLCGGHAGIRWLDPATGRTGMLLDEIDGRPIPGVNEMIPDREGGLYFGVIDIPAVSEHRKMEPGGLYHVGTDLGVQLVRDGIPFANGIALSSDGTTLYCNETGSGTTAYEIQADGSGGEPVLLQPKQDADGIAVDANGDLWVTGFNTGEILRVAPGGTVREKIATPAPGISNIRFGGADGRDVYITATHPATMAEFGAGRPLSTKGSRLLRGRSDSPGLTVRRTQFTIA